MSLGATFEGNDLTKLEPVHDINDVNHSYGFIIYHIMLSFF